MSTGLNKYAKYALVLLSVGLILFTEQMKFIKTAKAILR